MLVLIDSDSLCYANAFAVQEKNDIGDVQVVENGEKYLRSKLRRAIAKIVEETEATDYKLYLTGKGNFRESSEGEEPSLYKANRKDMVRPLLLPEAREYLVEEFNAIVVNDMEADDMVCIEQTYCMENDIDSCIAHIDKDINQQAGWHYKWEIFGKPSEMYFVTEEEGLRNLYVQALVGDKVDNIMYYLNEESGTWKKHYGIGQKTAEKYLSGYHTEEEMYQAVLDCYLTHPKFTKKDTGVQTTVTDLLGNMLCLYLLRYTDDEWTIPHG